MPTLILFTTHSRKIDPPSDRIVQDILALPDHLDKIIEAKGCVVSDIKLRHGRRYERADGNGLCEKKPRASQRKSTLKARLLHPDCQDAMEMLTSEALEKASELADAAQSEEPAEEDQEDDEESD